VAEKLAVLTSDECGTYYLSLASLRFWRITLLASVRES